MSSFNLRIAIFLLLFVLITCEISAKVSLPDIVSNGMVLQRNEVVKIWGWAGPRERVSISFMKKSYSTTTGRDGKYEWANAGIINYQVVFWSDKIENPKSVRYAWADNPDFANLCNTEGLPASPFQINVDQNQ